MRVFPVEDNLFHVVERVEQEMITPFSPADGHGAISVHTGNENYSMPKEHLQHGRFSNKAYLYLARCSSALFAVLCWIIYILYI